MSGHISAAHISTHGSPSLAIRNGPLHRRAPPNIPPPNRSPPRQSSPSPQPQRPRVETEIKIKQKGPLFLGSTFVKNGHGKHRMIGPDALVQGAWSRDKVSAGGTQYLGGQSKMRAEASGRNVAIKLDFPSGSKGSYTTMGSTGKTKHIVDHTQSPFKMSFPPDGQWAQMTAVAKVEGPGSVKVKAWN